MKFNRFFAFALLNICMMTLPMTARAYMVGPVSEEYPPITCDTGDAIYAASCEGDYCDNTELYCAETNYPVWHRYWTPQFSEETGLRQECGENEIMTGLACAGDYCDNVSIECSYIGITRSNCELIGPFSEEQTYVDLGGRYANGMECTGDNCDNHYFYVCNF